MKEAKERKVAYGLAIILFVVGLICYGAFPVTTPEPPVMVMFKSAAGKVLFDHKIHTAESGYEIECVDCHHDIEDPRDRPETCGECHMKDDAEDSPKKSDAFHTLCIQCHDDGGAGPVECFECHIM